MSNKMKKEFFTAFLYQNVTFTLLFPSFYIN